jgi:uncharacterized membrane protein
VRQEPARGGRNHLFVGTSWGTTRTEAFSDGVFAIAITLLVLEIDVPESDFGDLLHGILDQWPSYLAYVTSFATVGGIWLAHHGIFRRLGRLNGAVMRWNLLLLLAVSFLPFPTRLVAEAMQEADAERTAVVFYGAWLVVIAVCVSLLWRSIVRHRTLLRDDVTDADVVAMNRATTPNIGFFAVATGFAFAFPRAAAFIYLVIAVRSLVGVRGDEDEPLRAGS